MSNFKISNNKLIEGESFHEGWSKLLSAFLTEAFKFGYNRSDFRIYEKHGYLSISKSDGKSCDLGLEEFIDRIELKSEYICEFCGKEETEEVVKKLTSSNWLKSVCNTCHEYLD